MCSTQIPHKEFLDMLQGHIGTYVAVLRTQCSLLKLWKIFPFLTKIHVRQMVMKSRKKSYCQHKSVLELPSSQVIIIIARYQLINPLLMSALCKIKSSIIERGNNYNDRMVMRALSVLQHSTMKEDSKQKHHETILNLRILRSNFKQNLRKSHIY